MSSFCQASHSQHLASHYWDYFIQPVILSYWPGTSELITSTEPFLAIGQPSLSSLIPSGHSKHLARNLWALDDISKTNLLKNVTFGVNKNSTHVDTLNIASLRKDTTGENPTIYKNKNGIYVSFVNLNFTKISTSNICILITFLNDTGDELIDSNISSNISKSSKWRETHNLEQNEKKVKISCVLSA